MVAQPVLLYDGDCRFCRASAKVISLLDRERRFAVLPFSDELAGELLGAIPAASRGRSIHIVQPDGWIVSAGDALIELTRVLPGGGLLAAAAWKNAGAHRMFAWAYRTVADNRGALSQFVPNVVPPIRRPRPS